MKAALPANEEARVTALREYEILDTPPEEAFDDIAALAAHICAAPIALVTLVDSDRQWFKARVGLSLSETPRDYSFCAHTILETDDVFIVPDALADERFADNPLVTAEPHIRFYAGAPLVTKDGFALGSLCVIDRVPRDLDAEQTAALRALRRYVVNELELRRLLRLGHSALEDDLRESRERFEATFELAAVGIAHVGPDGHWLRVNGKLCDMVGYTREELLGLSFQDITHPEDLGKDLEYVRRMLAGEIDTYSMDKRYVRKDGSYVWINLTKSLVRNPAGEPAYFIAVIKDISDRKKAEELSETINGELLAINRIVSACAGTLDLKELLDRVLGEALGIAGLEGGTFCLLSPEGTLHLVAQRGASATTVEDLTTHTIRVGDCLCGECARDLSPLILRDRQAVLKFSSREASRNEDIRFHAAFPCVTGGVCVGVLCIFTRTDSKPAERSLKLLEAVTGHLALAVENARLYEQTARHAAELEERVKERTAELERKNAELERMNRLFVGRELRMRELKEKIRELEGHGDGSVAGTEKNP